MGASFIVDGMLKLTAKLFLLAKYPEGRRRAEGRLLGSARVAGARNGAFLLGESGLGGGIGCFLFATGESDVSLSLEPSVAPNHFPANACRFAGLGWSRSISSVSSCVDGRGRLAGEECGSVGGAGFLGDGRVTGGAKAAEKLGLGFGFEGDAGDGATVLGKAGALGVKEKVPVDFLG